MDILQLPGEIIVLIIQGISLKSMIDFALTSRESLRIMKQYSEMGRFSELRKYIDDSANETSIDTDLEYYNTKLLELKRQRTICEKVAMLDLMFVDDEISKVCSKIKSTERKNHYHKIFNLSIRFDCVKIFRYYLDQLASCKGKNKISFNKMRDIIQMLVDNKKQSTFDMLCFSLKYDVAELVDGILLRNDEMEWFVKLGLQMFPRDLETILNKILPNAFSVYVKQFKEKPEGVPTMMDIYFTGESIEILNSKSENGKCIDINLLRNTYLSNYVELEDLIEKFSRKQISFVSIGY